MIYSVYDYRKGRYRYYEALGSTPATGWFRKPRNGSKVPEAMAAQLPAEARPLGEGAQARGLLAEPSPGLAGFSWPSSGSVLPWVVAGLVGVLLCRRWRA